MARSIRYSKMWFSIRNVPLPGRFFRVILLAILGGTIFMNILFFQFLSMHSKVHPLAREAAERTITAQTPGPTKGKNETLTELILGLLNWRQL